MEVAEHSMPTCSLAVWRDWWERCRGAAPVGKSFEEQKEAPSFPQIQVPRMGAYRVLLGQRQAPWRARPVPGPRDEEEEGQVLSTAGR